MVASLTTIKINIKNKTPTAEEKYEIVCGNSDYIIKFAFDSEWDNYDIKTARFNFTQNGAPSYIDVVFEGDECPVPILSNIQCFNIGVFAGDLHTTAPCLIVCKKSILCDNGTPAEPPEDVYNQIMEKCNEAVTTAKAVEEAAEAGEFKGEKGDKGDKGEAGAIKFIVVNELPIKNIVTDAIYLLPSNAAEENNVFDEYVYTDDAWEKIGSAGVEVNLDEYVKNTDYATSDKAGVILVSSSFGIDRFVAGGWSGFAKIVKAEKSDINAKSNAYKPIVPALLDYAIKEGLTANTETLTDEEKAAACEWVGALEQPTNNMINDRILARRSGTDENIWMKVDASNGLSLLANGNMIVSGATKGYIDEKKSGAKPIAPNMLDYAVKVGLTTNTETLTEEEKAAACEWVGGIKKPTTTTSLNRVVAIKNNTLTETYFDATSSLNRHNQIPISSLNGTLYVGTPTEDGHAATKKYVDDAIAALKAELKGE